MLKLCGAVDVIQPSLPLPLITAPFYTLVALNLFVHYYYVCTVPPGFVNDHPRQSGNGFLWARKRKEARNRAMVGVKWSDDVVVTKALVTKCRKCGVMRPEVSSFFLISYLHVQS